MRHSIGATNNHSQNSIRPCSNRAFRAYDDFFFHHWQRYTSPFLCYTRNHIRRNWFTKILDWLSRHAHQTNFLLYYQRNHIPRISIAIYENISPEISSLYAWHLRRRTLQTLCVNVKKKIQAELKAHCGCGILPFLFSSSLLLVGTLSLRSATSQTPPTSAKPREIHENHFFGLGFLTV